MSVLANIPPEVVAASIAAGVSATVTLLLARWNPRNERNLERLKSELQRDLENELGDRAIERQYEFDARKRLYSVIGPPRFQLLTTCRAAAERITGLGTNMPYELEPGGYFGRNTLHRLLQPLALVEIITRQVAYYDFAIDQGALDCLRIKRAFAIAWSGDAFLLNHPKANWEHQVEHVYGGRRTSAVSALILESEETLDRVMRFEEFDALPSEEVIETFAPFPDLLNRLDPNKTPILWLRLIAYANSCNAFVNLHGSEMGFENREFPVRELLQKTDDAYIKQNLDEYGKVIEANALMSL